MAAVIDSPSATNSFLGKRGMDGEVNNMTPKRRKFSTCASSSPFMMALANGMLDFAAFTLLKHICLTKVTNYSIFKMIIDCKPLCLFNYPRANQSFPSQFYPCNIRSYLIKIICIAGTFQTVSRKRSTDQMISMHDDDDEDEDRDIRYQSAAKKIRTGGSSAIFSTFTNHVHEKETDR